jgi:hypothetical protein
MHGMNIIKFANAKQAKAIYLCKNNETKLQTTNAAIWYNKMCKQLQLSPSYTHIKGNGSNHQSYNTQKVASQFTKKKQSILTQENIE